MFNNPLLSAGCSEQFRPRFCWKVRLMHQFRSRECVLILGTRLCDSTCKIIFLSFRILVKFNLGFPPFVGDGRLSCDILEAWYRLYISCTPCLLFDGAQPREKVQMADPKFQADCRPQSLWVTGCDAVALYSVSQDLVQSELKSVCWKEMRKEERKCNLRKSVG